MKWRQNVDKCRCDTVSQKMPRLLSLYAYCATSGLLLITPWSCQCSGLVKSSDVPFPQRRRSRAMLCIDDWNLVLFGLQAGKCNILKTKIFNALKRSYSFWNCLILYNATAEEAWCSHPAATAWKPLMMPEGVFSQSTLSLLKNSTK